MDKMDYIFLIAHQLKKPLSTIKLSLEMLFNGDFGKINKEQKYIIKKILQNNKMLIYLVENVLGMAKVGDKWSSYSLTSVDVEDLIRFVVSFTKEEIKKKRIKFKLKKPKIKLPKILLDKEKMYLALSNIFDNAVKYTPDGGSVNIFIRSDEKNLEIKIQDSGIGITDSQKEKLFNKFFRGTNAIKVNPSGSGLGLFIAKNIIEGHHGKIWFESRENKGSAFFITLPIKPY